MVRGDAGVHVEWGLRAAGDHTRANNACPIDEQAVELDRLDRLLALRSVHPPNVHHWHVGGESLSVTLQHATQFVATVPFIPDEPSERCKTGSRDKLGPVIAPAQRGKAVGSGQVGSVSTTTGDSPTSR